MKKFKVTRKFTGGVLAGLIYTEVSCVGFPVGFKCEKPVAGSPFVIIACEEVQ